ncbi:MAG TPA: M10 family metallopeptidase C-terminal domain-containing protein, partial [Allosphingosinicella sp.]
GSGADILIGGAGNDLIKGGLAADILTGNGGSDSFRYDSTSESAAAGFDRILDFTPGTDKIDLTRIDADGHAGGDQAFHWIGSNAFTGFGTASAGELRAYQNGGTWFVEADTDGNGSADLIIELTLQGATPLGQGDFVL